MPLLDKYQNVCKDETGNWRVFSENRISKRVEDFNQRNVLRVNDNHLDSEEDLIAMEFNVVLLANMESQHGWFTLRDIPRGHQPPQDHLGMPEWQRPSQFPWKCKTKPQCACQPPTPGMTANATCLGVGGASGTLQNHTRLLRYDHNTIKRIYYDLRCNGPETDSFIFSVYICESVVI